MPFKPIEEFEATPAPRRERGGFRPLVEPDVPRETFDDPIEIPDDRVPRRIQVAPEPSVATSIAGAVRSALKSLLPAAPGVMDQPSPAELEAAERPVTGIARTPAGRQFSGTPDTRPVVPPPREARPAPRIEPPSRSPITGEVSFTPFARERPTPSAVVRELPGAFSRGAGRMALEGSRLGSILTGDLDKARELDRALGILAGDEREVAARTSPTGEAPTAIQAAGALPQSLAYMGAFAAGGAPLAIAASQPQIVDSYVKHRKNGNTPLGSFVASQGGVLSEVVPERIGWQLLVDLFKLPANATRREFLTRLGVQQAGEQAEEQITTLANFAIDRMMNDPEATADRLWKEMKDTAAVTTYLAPVLGGTAVGARGAVRGVEKLEERFMPERSIARALRDVLEEGPVRSAPRTERRLTIEGESREPIAPVAGRVATADGGSLPRLPEPTIADRLAELLEEPAASASGDLPTLLPDFGGQRRTLERRFPAIQIPDTGDDGDVPRAGVSIADSLARELDRRRREAEEAAPPEIGPEEIYERRPPRPERPAAAPPPVREDETDLALASEELPRAPEITSMGRRQNRNILEARRLRELLADTESRAERREIQARIDELESDEPSFAQQVHGSREPGRVAQDDPFAGFKAETGKYPWEMAFPEFYKHVVSRVKKAMPGKDAKWYENWARSQWAQAKDFARGERVFGSEEFEEEGITVPMAEIREKVRQQIAEAERRQPAFERLVNEIAAETGAAPIVAPVKGESRTLEKVITDYEGDVTKVKDLNRGTLVVDAPQQVGAVVERVLSRSPNKPIKVDNLYERGPLPTGYMGANVVLDEGGPVEVQVNTPEMTRAKIYGHPYYVETEALFRRAFREKREFTTQEAEAYQALVQRQIEIYSAARDENAQRVSRGQRMSVDQMRAMAMTEDQDLLAGELRRIETILSKAGLSSGTSDAKLGGRPILRGGETSQARATPVAGSTVTGTPSNDQYSTMADTVAQEESDAVPSDKVFGSEETRQRDRANGKRPEDPVATAGRARDLEKQYPPAKSRHGKCHQLTWRKVTSFDLRQIIGVTRSPIGLMIWHSVAQDPETGNIWEPIANRWYTPGVMTEAFGYEPVVSLSAQETWEHSAASGYYTDQTVVKPKGWDRTFMIPGGGEYEPDPSIFETKPQASEEFRNITDERDGREPPKMGEPFIVYRLGRLGGAAGLENRNGGNSEGVASHLARVDDVEKPQPAGGTGNAIKAFRVVVNEPWGEYAGITEGKADPLQKNTASIGRKASIHKDGSGATISYSFPSGTQFTAEQVAEVPLDSVREILLRNLSRIYEERGYGYRPTGSFDEAGTIEGARAIREAFEKSQDVALADDEARGSLVRRPLPEPAGPTDEHGLKPLTAEQSGIKGPSAYAGIFKPTAGQMEAIGKAATHLANRVSPGVLAGLKGVVVYSDRYSKYIALYWPRVNVIGLNEARLNELAKTPEGLGDIARYMAHELTHAIDRTGPESLFSHTVKALDLHDRDADGVPVQPLVREVFALMGHRAPEELGDYFQYPVMNFARGDMPEDIARSEIVAQVGALFLTRPDTVRRHLPAWYPIMEQIYGTPPRFAEKRVPPPQTLGDAHRRLRLALEGASAEQRDQGDLGRDRDDEAGRDADRPGSQRGPPRSRVGDGTGEPSFAAQGQPPAGGARGPVGANAYWDIDEPGLRDNLVREWQNNKIDLKKTQEAIEGFAGYGVIPQAGDAYLAEERYHGRVSALIKKFTRDTVEPLLKEIKESNVTIDEVGDYLWARHAPERNAQMAKINPGGPADLSGMSNADAAAKIAGFTAAHKIRELRRIASRIDAITKATRTLIVQNGLESQATINAWEGAYKNYVPLFRDDDDAGGTGQGFKVIGPESKRAMGSQRAARAIVAAVIAQHERAIVRSEKAEVGRALIKLAEQFPNPDFWKVDSPPMKRSINPTTGLVQVGVDPLYRQRDDVFIVKERAGNGAVVERVLSFNPRRERAMQLAAAMKNLGVVQLDGMTKAVGRVSRLLANLATSWNPLFWATNFARDVQTAAVNLQSTPLNGHAPQVIANIPQAIAGIADAEFRNGTSTWATYYREFEQEGGKTGWMTIFEDLRDRQEELAAEIKRSQRSKIDPRKWVEWSLDLIEKTNSAIENATRLSAYVEARSIGMSPAKAASLAKNLTVNFNRKGNRSSATNAWYMFFNANVQGTARLVQAVAKSPKARAMVGVMVAVGAALELLNRMIGDDDRDEDGNNTWELMPEHVKQKNLVLMLPGGKRASIPMPYGFNVFFNAGRMMMETVLANTTDMVDEKKKPLDQAWNFAEVLIDSFLPLGQSSSLSQLISPSVLDPFVQYAENRTWYGSPMRPEPSQFAPARPDHKLFFRTTSETAKDLTKWLSDVTGGDEIRGGAIDISPTTISHIFSTITGGAGRFGLGMFDFSRHLVGRMTGEAEPEDLPWQRVPFVGTFFGEITDRERAAKFYRLRPEAMELQKQLRAYRKEGLEDKAQELEEEKPGLAAMAREITSREFQKDLKGTRDEMKELENLPAAERQRLRRQMQEDEGLVLSRAIREYNDAQRGAR